MNVQKLILTIIKQIERLDPTLFVYGYQNSNLPHSNTWYEISVSDYEFYMNDERFKSLEKKWGKIAKNSRVKIIFVCGWKPTEERLVKLMNENNLILNIE